MDLSEITDILRKCLEKGTIDSFGDSDLRTLLNNNSDSVESVRNSIIGYPTYPLYKDLSKKLHSWLLEGCCVLDSQMQYDLLDESAYLEQRQHKLNQVSELLDGLKSLWSCWNEEEKIAQLRKILEVLTKRGVLDLLGVRKTVGSVDVWPPSRDTLIASFTALHCPGGKSVLTVGARALTKHHHRDQSDSWWGVCTGTEANKNEHALSVMNKILDAATWINIHQLPHDIQILEIRQEHGYGVRWLADGSMFRGFVEPQMEDGHSVGWVH